MCMHTRVCAHMFKLYERMLHAYVHKHGHACTHYGSRNYERQVFYIKVWFWNESHIVWGRFKPPFSNYKMPYMVPFQKTQKILRENSRFTRNSKSKREFFTKHLQVNIFLIEAFSGFDLWVSSLLITSLFWFWIDLLRGRVKIKLRSFVFWGIIFEPLFFCFLVLIFIYFVFFLCLCYNMFV